MRVLQDIHPTGEQLTIFGIDPAGTVILRGAAGSGKTTTALLRLKYLADYWADYKSETAPGEPVRMLVLTYNRTLRGYIRQLALEQITPEENVEIEVSTFSRWAWEVLGRPALLNPTEAKELQMQLRTGINLSWDFLASELDYVLGRFLPANLPDYLEVRRSGRGASPRVDRGVRQQILTLIAAYSARKTGLARQDYNDLAVDLAVTEPSVLYDVVIIDEAQDFSANQLRAIRNHLAPAHSLTIVIDAAQRIYPRGYLWREVGITPVSTHRLGVNFRNTVEIAKFAQPLLAGLDVSDDGTIPDFRRSTRHGPTPEVLVGKYSQQAAHAVRKLRAEINLDEESVAFLHPKGWFGELRNQLQRAGIEFVELTRLDEWPEGDANVALSTLHSAKGLEFDHVFVLGLSGETTRHGAGEDDAELETLRKLLAMGLGRARQSVTVGYKPGEESTLIRYFEPGTFVERNL